MTGSSWFSIIALLCYLFNGNTAARITELLEIALNDPAFAAPKGFYDGE